MNFESLVLATGNTHKVSEVSQILGMPVEGKNPDVEETGLTFEANALIKARALAETESCWVLADDSGLEVDALDGAPGIYSARYAGEHGNDAANNAKLLEELSGTETRTARFVCALALCGPNGEEQTIRGTCEGQIALEASGSAGFGYDPLFIPDGYDTSFAELGADVKKRISHRADALKKLQDLLNR